MIYLISIYIYSLDIFKNTDYKFKYLFLNINKNNEYD